jgi:hypothetical protein
VLETKVSDEASCEPPDPGTRSRKLPADGLQYEAKSKTLRRVLRGLSLLASSSIGWRVRTEILFSKSTIERAFLPRPLPPKLLESSLRLGRQVMGTQVFSSTFGDPAQFFLVVHVEGQFKPI